MYTVSARTKNSGGSITHPVKKFYEEPSAEDLRELRDKVCKIHRKVYPHGRPQGRPTCDFKIENPGA